MTDLAHVTDINGCPPRQGLYDPQHERDSCGVGFVVDMKGTKSHEIVVQALRVLANLDHRGARGAEVATGDGAGILLQLPHRFFHEVCGGIGFSLPRPGDYAVGVVFLPRDDELRQHRERVLEDIVRQAGQDVLGWRDVPTSGSSLGETARSAQPKIRQVFIGRNPCQGDPMAFERKLYVIRRRAENAIRYDGTTGGRSFYVASLSSRTICYKGMLTSRQLETFYPDLDHPLMESALALVHSRFSTNTFPSWERAQPFRYVIHNGEINALRGNVNWMRAREALFRSDCFGEDLQDVLPAIQEDGSDSAKFDNCLELLVLAGRPLSHAIMMMIPEPWENHGAMDDARRAFYEFHSCLMEPWDGPACIGFTDGIRVGAVLDRNGLRPARYYVTADGLVIMASEVGVLDVPPSRVVRKGRLEPGRMLLVDTEDGRIIGDDELKRQVISGAPYRQWLDEHLTDIAGLPAAPCERTGPDPVALLQRQRVFGYTFEDIRVNLIPMARDAIQPIGSMGNDTPLAVLSNQPQLLYSYFKQLFAQVTNPPIDPIREEMVTSTETTLGSERNLLHPEPESCRQIRLPTPILKDEELEKLRHLDHPGFGAAVLPIVFRVVEGEAGLERALDGLFQAADRAIREGANVLILSDRGFGPEQAPIPALLAVASLHHHLIRTGARTRVGLVLESGEPREVHHFCLLLGYGAQAINPYLVYESLAGLIREGFLTEIDYSGAVEHYNKAVVKGVVKVMAKMGISTIKSYCGAQIFEALGIRRSVLDRFFCWTDSRVEGIGLDVIALEVLRRHEQAFPRDGMDGQSLPAGGQYQWRSDGESHLFNPLTIHKLQLACRTNSYATYREYADLINNQSENPVTLRGLLEFRFAPEPVPLDEVESVESICQRFKTGAMSYGSISQEAHETLAIAMNRIGGKSNTGEGGEDPRRYAADPNGDSRNSAIKQVASGRFGVTSDYLIHARELQIKMAQGAKPGEGGELPGRKVYPWIAKVRHSTPGVGLISPPPHHDIYSIEDLAQLIYDLKCANRRARISVKLVSEVGVGTIAAGVAKGHADVILISGHDGGTGASPQTSIKHAGLPWELGLAETHQTLLLNNLRSRVVLETDGQLKTGRDVAIAALLGAEEFGFATTPLVALGCTMMRVCHLDTCPMGIATQNPELRQHFTGRPEYVVHFMRFIAQDLREIMSRLGFRTLYEMVGRTDCLEPRKAIDHWKAKDVDLAAVLYQPTVSWETGRRCMQSQDHGMDRTLDSRLLLNLCRPALEKRETVVVDLPIRNSDRAVGTMLGSEVTRQFGPPGLPPGTIHLRFHGSAGQSFGAFVPPGVTLELEGDANDYFGKGLSGGVLIAYPPKEFASPAEENVLVGNVTLYGATSGEAYLRGVAGERFAVRNSGALAVVEGVGDHGCEYMTGGRVVILGRTGRNFAAGMSGGIAYALDETGDFASRCNRSMVTLERLENPVEISEVEQMVWSHARYTGSQVAWKVLALWESSVPKFIKVMPRDYRRMLEEVASAEKRGAVGDDAVMAAFQANRGDLSRVSGN